VELTADTFRLLVESVQDYAIYVLAPDGTVQSWNAGAARLKGYTAHEIIGRNFEAFFSKEDRAAGKPKWLLHRALTTGPVEDLGWRVRKDGSQFWASALLTPLKDASGRHIGFAKVTRDLTDRGYRAFVEATHAIVWTADSTGKPNADSRSWRDFTGQSEDDWREQRAWEVVHIDDRPIVRDAWTRAKASAAPFDAQFRLRRADGEYVWMEGRAVPFLDGEGRVREWFGVALDIAARKLAELNTQRALELWKTTLRSIGDAVISTDGAGRVRFMNAVAERLTEWTAREAEGRPLHEVFAIFNADTGDPAENPVDKALREGVVVGLANHTVMRRRGGTTVPIADSAAPIRDPDGTIEGVVLVFRDATDENRELVRRAFLATATEKLIEAGDHREALAEVARLAVPRLADFAVVHILDASSPRPVQIAMSHVDPAKAESAREVERRYPVDPDAPWGMPNVVRTGRAELYPELSAAQLEARAVDGEHLALMRALDVRSAIIVPLQGKGPVFGAITFAFTGTHRRYTERDLAFVEELARRAALIIERRRLEEEAERANRLKDEFLATISHELRTPLQAIVGYTSMLRSGIARDPSKALEAIERNAAAQSRLVEDILDISRISSGKLRLAIDRVDLAAAVRAALDSIRPAAQARQVRLVEELPDDLGAILGDFDRIQQIIWNLLSNAVKFTTAGGVVEVFGQRTGSLVRLSVRDSGKGIPPQHLATIFERFLQLDSSITRQTGGLGLGLAIARHLVEAHGGTISAESEGPGKGATFTVALPARMEALQRSELTRGAPPVAARPLRGIRVLLVDDDPDARELISDVVTAAGAVVTKAASAHEAYAALRADAPHVLISDIGMPGEDGYSLIRRVRALPPEHGGDVPAIALTAYGRPEDVRAATEAGFQLHVVKPVKPDALLGAITAWARPR
jgi:PAS domain S-box-containing protein